MERFPASEMKGLQIGDVSLLEAFLFFAMCPES
jgi:hypothetical protein